MRGQYLYLLGHFCHIPPKDVGELTIGDFFNLLDNIDAHVAALEKAGK